MYPLGIYLCTVTVAPEDIFQNLSIEFEITNWIALDFKIGTIENSSLRQQPRILRGQICLRDHGFIVEH